MKTESVMFQMIGLCLIIDGRKKDWYERSGYMKALSYINPAGNGVSFYILHRIPECLGNFAVTKLMCLLKVGFITRSERIPRKLHLETFDSWLLVITLLFNNMSWTLSPGLLLKHARSSVLSPISVYLFCSVQLYNLFSSKLALTRREMQSLCEKLVEVSSANEVVLADGKWSIGEK